MYNIVQILSITTSLSFLHLQISFFTNCQVVQELKYHFAHMCTYTNTCTQCLIDKIMYIMVTNNLSKIEFIVLTKKVLSSPTYKYSPKYIHLRTFKYCLIA